MKDETGSPDLTGPVDDDLAGSLATATEAESEDGAAEPVEDVVLTERQQEILRAEARRAIEAVVLVAEDPVNCEVLSELTGRPAAECDEICDELVDWYEDHDRGFQMVRVAGGYRFQTHPDQADVVKRFVLVGQSPKLSAAALETLAIVAYKQPVSRAQIAAIRGVGVDGVMRTLQQRGYIEEIARDPGPGQAVLYGTTLAFLEKLGLDELDELPPLGDFVPAPEVVEALEAGLTASDSDNVVEADTSTNSVAELSEKSRSSDADSNSDAGDMAEVIDLRHHREAPDQ